ncbi:MAG: head GIN domain-containing protein [Bacteroidota bacterium]
MYRIVKLVTTLALLSFFALTGCEEIRVCTPGEGALETRTLNIDAFNGITLSSNAKVYLTQDSVQSVTITAQSNLIDILKTDVSNQIWKIDFEGCITDHEDIEIYISAPDLRQVKISGAGDIIGQTPFDVADMDLIISGSGDISMDLTAQHVLAKISGAGNIGLDLDVQSLESKINGAGDLSFAGTALSHDASISGSGNISAFDLASDEVIVKVSGAGNTEVSVAQTLDVTISGSGNVAYKGSPSLNLTVRGAGKVIDAN